MNSLRTYNRLVTFFQEWVKLSKDCDQLFSILANKVLLMRLILLLFIFISSQATAQVFTGEKSVKHNPKAAGCAPPSKTTFMELNNVRMMVHTAGNLWQVPGQNISSYEVPKNSGIMALFTAALWLGGTDINGQLKLAALRYRDGQDYWTGPLSQNFAEISAEECIKYDKHFITTQDDIRTFYAWYQAGIYDQENGTNTQATFYPDYQVPEIIKTWPAHGDESLGQDYYLAPFFDNDGDGSYNWQNGDFPWHDITKSKVCSVDRAVSLYGDLNYWWVMNDKGNIHTETEADPIGMEIRAQAFCFASNDEINNMTFYNYELINRGTQTLQDTYFGSFTDGALGDPFDDYVGCDVMRGLGYYYNGDNYDGDNLGFYGYGFNPPAVGVDFFEGPYQDNDGIDNDFGIQDGEALNGIGYGDGIIDNERFGMRRFLYYSNTTAGANPSQTDPIAAEDYYNYLKGFWKDGTKFVYGGSGHISDPDANPDMPCDFMFPGDTDSLGWGTNGIAQVPWTEQTANNVPNDRRFVQSAGPFVLKPGAVNNITVGVVWARAKEGDPFASVEVLRRADDKAQALFENCFKVLDGPNAPDVAVQELENELILTLSNPSSSNNFNEEYIEFDPFISTSVPQEDRNYVFQGYQIFQLVNDEVALSDLEDAEKARLVAQCDIEDDVSRIINFEFDEQIQASIPIEKVDGENKGIQHSFLINQDLFAQGDKKLVNFKTYYYMAISYAYNNYKDYDPTDPDLLDGQKKRYLGSRKAAFGEVKIVSGIPHSPMPEAGGTIQFVEYGTSPEITRLDGVGNGNRSLELTNSSITSILSNGHLDRVTYTRGNGPIDVKVIDPLNVSGGYYTLKFHSYTPDPLTNEIDTAKWTAYRYESEGSAIIDSVTSDQSIARNNEQLIPQWGVSIQLHNRKYEAIEGSNLTKLTAQNINSSVTFADSSKQWLSFISDNDIFFPTNWIGSGSQSTAAEDCQPDLGIQDPCLYNDFIGVDPDQNFEKILGGGVAPHRLVRYDGESFPLAYIPGISVANPRSLAGNAFLPSVNIVLTQDKSKWTRCPVIEMGSESSLNVGGAEPGQMRKSQSVDKNGNPDGTGTGMGWFPGYAIDLETGSRLHIAFGENSFLGSDGGADMRWNPSSRFVDGTGNPVFGGLHPIWVFGNRIKTQHSFPTLFNLNYYDPSVDETSNRIQQLMQIMESTSSTVPQKNDAAKEMYGSLMWIVNPILKSGESLLSTDALIRIRMNKEYKNFSMTNQNLGRPMYSWNMDDIATVRDDAEMLAEALEIINIVPNPYNAFSEYERNRIDSRVKITNLPEKCSIKIYTVGGKLVKSFEKDSPVTYVDWLLINNTGIPVSSGIYLIHVDVPGVGERVLKFFCAMRQVDLYGT